MPARRSPGTLETSSATFVACFTATYLLGTFFWQSGQRKRPGASFGFWWWQREDVCVLVGGGSGVRVRAVSLLVGEGVEQGRAIE